MTASSAFAPASIARSSLLGAAILCLTLGVIGVPYLVTGSLRVYMFAYPAMALALALALYAVSRPVYVGFAIWVWLLTPLVRRLHDYGMGIFTESSPIMTAPYLVGGVGVLGLWAVLTQETRGVRQAYYFPMVALVYGVAVGVVVNGVGRVPMDLLEWVIPLITAALILADWRQYPRYRDVALRTITVAMGVLGVYGLYQFFVLPPWDRFWMESVEDVMINIGRPYPLEVRIFGTMNSPNPYGVTLAVGIIGLLASGVRSRRDALLARLAAGPAVAALAISTVRSGWGACVVGLVYVLIATQSQNRWKVMAFTALLAVAVGAAMLLEPVQGLLVERAATITQIQDNGSFQARSDLYATALPAILANPVGWGLGNRYPVDSGLIRTFATLGWMGTALYMTGLLLLFWWSWRMRMHVPSDDIFIPVATGVAVAMLSTLPLGASFEGPKGVFLWGFLSLAIAGIRYHHAAAHGTLPGAPSTKGPPDRAPDRVPAPVTG